MVRSCKHLLVLLQATLSFLHQLLVQSVDKLMHLSSDCCLHPVYSGKFKDPSHVHQIVLALHHNPDRRPSCMLLA